MEIDKDIENMLKDINPEPRVIKVLLKEFIGSILENQDGLKVPLPCERYQFCLIDSPESFLGYLCREEHVGFMDELSIMNLWNYRYRLEAHLKPFEKAVHLIALRVFLKWCYQKGLLCKDISDTLQMGRSNRIYIVEMDPCAVDIVDLL